MDEVRCELCGKPGHEAEDCELYLDAEKDNSGPMLFEGIRAKHVGMIVAGGVLLLVGLFVIDPILDAIS